MNRSCRIEHPAKISTGATMPADISSYLQVKKEPTLTYYIYLSVAGNDSMSKTQTAETLHDDYRNNYIGS